MVSSKILGSLEEVNAKGPFQPAWESLKDYSVPDWYKDAKFGIFIHWGPYCVPAYGNAFSRRPGPGM